MRSLKIKIVYNKYGKTYQVWLINGVQRFPVGSPHDDKEGAAWYAKMLQKALHESSN